MLSLYGGDGQAGLVHCVRDFETAKKASTIRLVTKQKQIEQEIKLYMKDNEFAVNDGYKISWSNVDTTRLDTKKIKEEKPEIYKAYAKTSSTRRFQIKAA